MSNAVQNAFRNASQNTAPNPNPKGEGSNRSLLFHRNRKSSSSETPQRRTPENAAALLPTKEPFK